MPNVPSEMNAILDSEFKADLVNPSYGLPLSAVTGIYTVPVKQDAKVLAAAAAGTLLSGLISLI